MNKTLGYISAGAKAMISVALFLGCQLLALVLFNAFGLNYKVYEGTFIALYSTVIILVFMGYSALSSIKNTPLIKRDKIEFKPAFILVMIGFALLGIVSIYMLAANFISAYLTSLQGELEKYSESIDRFATMSIDDVPWWDPLVDVFASSLIIPLAEEMVFRGAIFGELSRKMNWILSAAISSLIFGLFHGISIHIGYAIISGMILCVIYRFTNSIFASYIVHATFNFFGSSVFTLIDSSIMSRLSMDKDSLNYALFLIEIFAILPASLGIYYFYTVYRSNKKEQKEVL